MSTPPAWITVEDVADYLTDVVLPDENLTLSTAAWKAAVEQRHPEYFDAAEPPVYFPPDDVRFGAIRAAALTYKDRLTGGGETMWDSLGPSRNEIMRLLRWRRPELA